MNLFETKDKVESLKRKSGEAISVFKRTIADLSSVNKEIEQAQEEKEQQINLLQSEVGELQGVRDENSLFISKINDFLGITKQD